MLCEGLQSLPPADRLSPHYSRRLLLQPSIRRYDKPDGGRARRSVGQHTVQVCFPPSRLRAPVSRGVSAVSSRALVNNVGWSCPRRRVRLNSVGGAHDEQVCSSDKEAGLDDSGNLVQGDIEFSRAVDSWEMDI